MSSRSHFRGQYRLHDRFYQLPRRRARSRYRKSRGTFQTYGWHLGYGRQVKFILALLATTFGQTSSNAAPTASPVGSGDPRLGSAGASARASNIPAPPPFLIQATKNIGSYAGVTFGEMSTSPGVTNGQSPTTTPCQGSLLEPAPSSVSLQPPMRLSGTRLMPTPGVAPSGWPTGSPPDQILFDGSALLFAYSLA